MYSIFISKIRPLWSLIHETEDDDHQDVHDMNITGKRWNETSIVNKSDDPAKVRVIKPFLMKQPYKSTT